MSVCEKCGKGLTHDEIGLYRKIVTRNAVSFLCVSCLAEKLSLPPKDLLEMIDRFKRAGCTLFSNY